MEATIVEFHAERGMGRAQVEGAGEMSFDASVVAAPFARLTAGTRVQVEMGPSRLGGQRIVKVTLPDGEPEPAAPIGPSKPVEVGRYVLQMPDFWTGGDVVAGTKGARYTGNGPGFVFEFVEYRGAGQDADVRAKLIANYARLYPGPTTTEKVTVAGAPFEGHVTTTDKLGPGSRFELNIGDVGGDLVSFGLALAPARVERAAEWSEYFRAIVSVAIMKRDPPV
jgi:hypothetical protein